MTTIAEARQSLADAVSTLPDVTCTPYVVPGNLRPGDAWVTVGRTEPGQFLRSNAVVLSATVCLGSDEPSAERLIDAWTIPLIDCTNPLLASGVFAEPQVMTAADSGSIYVLALSVTLDLSA